MNLPPELAPFVLELDDDELNFLKEIMVNCSFSLDSFKNWSDCLLFALIAETETYELRHKLRNLADHINSELFSSKVPKIEKKHQSEILKEVLHLLGLSQS